VADQRSASDKAQGSLLSPEQGQACQELAAQGSGLASQRAVALLSIDSGATHLKAATASGLTIGQVRYLLNIFRRKGMAIFPVDQGRSTAEKLSTDMPNSEDSFTASERTTVAQPTVEKKPKTVPPKHEKKDKGKKKDTKKAEDKKDAKQKKKNKKKKSKAKNKKQRIVAAC